MKERRVNSYVLDAIMTVGVLAGGYFLVGTFGSWWMILSRKLMLQSEQGFNPFKFGQLGASDSHNSSVPVEEYNYTGKIGHIDGTPAARLGGGWINSELFKYSAAGLAGVWASENTREAIFDAIRAKHVFATSGPRIDLVMAAGASLPDVLTDAAVDFTAADLAFMGGDLAQGEKIYVQAMRDPQSAPLQRLQIIKGWVAEGETHEQVTSNQ